MGGGCVPGDALAVDAAALSSGVRRRILSLLLSALAVEGGFLEVSVLGLLSCLSVLLVLYSASSGWAVVLRRMRGQIKVPTADGLSLRISCSLPMLGVCSLIWKGEVGGWLNRCSAWRTGERRRRLELRKKKNSWGLVVIFQFLRVLSIKKGCTVLLFSFGHTFVVVFSRQDVRNFLVRPQTRLNNVNIIFHSFYSII